MKKEIIAQKLGQLFSRRNFIIILITFFTSFFLLIAVSVFFGSQRHEMSQRSIDIMDAISNGKDVFLILIRMQNCA